MKKYEIYCPSCRKMTDASKYVHNDEHFADLSTNPSYICEECYLKEDDISPLEFDCRCELFALQK